MCRPLINLIISSWHQQAFSQNCSSDLSYLNELIPRRVSSRGMSFTSVSGCLPLCVYMIPRTQEEICSAPNLFSNMIIQHLKKYPIYSYHTTRTNISSNRTHANQWQYHRQYYTSYNNILTFFNIPSRDASLDACPDTSSIASVWSNASILFRSPSVSGSSSVKW